MHYRSCLPSVLNLVRILSLGLWHLLLCRLLAFATILSYIYGAKDILVPYHPVKCQE